MQILLAHPAPGSVRQERRGRLREALLQRRFRPQGKKKALCFHSAFRVRHESAQPFARSAAMRSSIGGCDMNRRFSPSPMPPLMPNAAIWSGSGAL